MAYKPPKQSIVDNDLKGVPSNEAVFEGLKLKLPKPSVDGTTGQLLARGASADDTSWVNPPTPGFANPMTTQGDIIVGGVAGAATRLGLGTVDKVAVSDGTTVSYQYAGLGGGALGTNNVVLGRAKPSSISGTNNFIAMASAGNALSTGVKNILIGVSAGAALTTATNVVAIGDSAASTSTSSGNVCVGFEAGKPIGNQNVCIGEAAATDATAALRNVVIGNYAGYALRGADGNVIIGKDAGFSTLQTGTNNVLIGRTADTAAAGTSSAVVIGRLGQAASNSVAIGESASTGTGVDNVVIGTNAGRSASTGANNTIMGRSAGDALTSGNANVLIGKESGVALTSGATNIFLGFTAGDAVTTGSNNVIIGDIAGTTTLADTVIVAAGTAERFRVDSSGNMGIGTTTPAEKLEVNGNIKASSGDVIIATAGKGLSIKSGTNAKIGTAQFTAQQTITVSTTAVTANSLIFVAGQDGTDAFAVQNKIAGTSFEIHHPGGNVTALVAWMIVEAP